MVIDISNITLENLNEYQCIFKKSREIDAKRNKYQEYQHKYYLEVTKPKRNAKKYKGGVIYE